MTAHVPEPTSTDPLGSGGDLSALRQGRTLYIQKCSGCHALYDVEKYSDSEWFVGVQEMIHLGKVKLTGVEHQTLLLYLTTYNGRE